MTVFIFEIVVGDVVPLKTGDQVIEKISFSPLGIETELFSSCNASF